MGLFSEFADEFVVFSASDHRLHAELGLENLGFLGIADQSGDVEVVRVGVLEETSEDSTADVA